MRKESEYFKLLRDPRWQRKRLEIMNRDDFACVLCQEKEKTLHVHHKIYKQGLRPWEYEDNLLVTMCEDCHESEKSTMEHYLKILPDYIKDKFLSDDVCNISHGFYCMEIIHSRDVTSTAFDWFFSNNGSKIMVDMYLQSLSKKDEKNEKI